MIKKIALLFLFAALVFSSETMKNIPKKASEMAGNVVEKVEDAVDSAKEKIVGDKKGTNVAVIPEESQAITSQEDATPVTIHDLTYEDQKNLEKLIKYHNKALLLEGQTDPKSIKELAKVQRKMITIQNSLEANGLNVDQAVVDWNAYMLELERLNEEQVLYKHFEQEADAAWYAEHPREIEDREIVGVDRIRNKIEKLKKKIQREEFKLAYVEERLSNPDKYLTGKYIFRFSLIANEQSIEELYATLAEKSIEVLHKYSIGQTFRGFSAVLNDTELGFILQNEIILSFESEGEPTFFARKSTKYVQTVADTEDPTCVDGVCEPKVIDE